MTATGAIVDKSVLAQQAVRRTRRNFVADGAMAVASGAALLIVLAILAVILFDVVRNGTPHLSWTFLTQAPRDGMTAGGIFPAIIGMLEMVILMTLAGVPVGVATAIYLHEYSSPISPVTRTIRIAVANLAGVPSIVFGLFGLGFFVQFLGAGIDKAFFHGDKVFGQPALIWAALTMAVLTLPVVIVATEEALRAVPQELREASLALGATKFQTVMHVVVPQAAPGILTGTILAVSRGAGEVAPILFTGAAYFLPQLPKHLSSQFMSPSYHVYVLSTQSPDVDATKPILYATVLVLLALTFTLNMAAVIVRARIRRQHAGAGVSATANGVAKAEPTAEAGRPQSDRLLRREEGGRSGGDGHRRAARHGAHRPVGLRQVDLPALAEPDERAHPRLPDRGRGQAGRRSDLRPGNRSGGGPAAHRDGVPALEPVPQVDRRERRLRPPHRRHQRRRATSTPASSGR